MKTAKRILSGLLAAIMALSIHSSVFAADFNWKDFFGNIVYNTIGPDGSSFLGYRYSDDGYYYCDDKDCWQKGVGYNEVYDKWAPVAAMYIDQIRVRFQYEGKNWMIQLWKGQYGYVLIGAEIGIYTCDLDKYSGGIGDINHFECADKSDWLKMQLDCYYSQGGKGPYNKIFTRPYDTYWWATGFVRGQLQKYTIPRTELKTKNRITFKSEDMANIFVQGLKVCGFQRAGDLKNLVDDSYYMEGKDVYVLWSTLYNDCFVNYPGRGTGLVDKTDTNTNTNTNTDTNTNTNADASPFITALVSVVNILKQLMALLSNFSTTAA